MTKRSWSLVVGWLAVVVIYAGLSRLWNDTDSAWYRGLTEPAWQPPDVVFGIIWPLNYLALAVVGVLVSRSRPGIAARMLGVFAVSAVFAVGWAYLFGQQESLGWSAASLVIATLLTWTLLALAWRAGKGYALGLIIYAAWMTLASSLAIGFLILN